MTPGRRRARDFELIAALDEEGNMTEAAMARCFWAGSRRLEAGGWKRGSPCSFSF
jgi:hypothetical protein